MSEGTVPTTTPTRESPDYGYTYGRASGNRVVEGSGRLPDSEPLDVELGGRPVWVAGGTLGEETAWVVALEDGRVEALRLDDETGAVEPTRIVPGNLPAGAPPAVRAGDERVELLVEPDDRGSHLTHPVLFGNGRLGVTEDGRLLVDPDEEELLAVTESAEGLGGRISVYRAKGELAAAGPFIGEGQKWRHLLAVGRFGPGGEIEISAMRTPHVAPRVEFYKINLESGELAAEGPGYPSHTIYSRNLDAARAGDLDGDGRWELLVPGPDLHELVAVRHERSGVEVAWRLPLGGELSTNFASAMSPEGNAQVAAGRADGILRIWP